MPIQSVRLKPGVDVEKTFTLNEAGYSVTQLTRFKDGLIQSLGGWVPFFITPLAFIPRVIVSWTDLNGTVFTAVGTDQDIYVINNNMLTDITPVETETNNTPNFSTVSGSPTVTIVDAGAVPIAGIGIQINTPVSVGGLILQGGYTIQSVINATTYTITATSPATATVNNGGAVPVFTTSSGNTNINVLLDNNGESVGSQFSVAVPTTVGGTTISGAFIVQAIVDANNFSIDSDTPASSTATGAENGGNAQIVYFNTTIGVILPNFGYGVGGYGLGGYGQGSAFTPSVEFSAPLWTLDHFGDILVACPGNGPIFTWTPDAGQASLQIIPTAPTVNGGIFVAQPALILVAWASSINGVQQPNLVQWSDQLNFDSWTPTVTNQAGNATIPTGSRIVAGFQAPNQSLIFTDIDVYAMNYLGSTGNIELVFGFIQIAKGCGLIGPRAVGTLNAMTFWLSQGQFMTLTSSGVQPIPCPIWDEIFQDLDQGNLEKIVCAPNSLFNEIGWFYPSISGGTGENDSYVKYNILENAWDFGKLVRTAWQDQSPAGNPIGGDSNGNLWQHEIGQTAGGQPLMWSFSTGAWQLGEGDQQNFVDWVLTDARFGLINNPTTNQNVTVTFNSYRYSNDPPVTSLPLVMTPQGNGELSTRMRGRIMQMNCSGTGFFRMGNVRVRYQPDGRY
jgi:hypothetical protein